MTRIVTLQMPPRTRRQAMADRKGKGVMVEEEPQRTDRAEEPLSPDRESLASIVQPEVNQVGPTGLGIDGAGPSRPLFGKWGRRNLKWKETGNPSPTRQL